MTEFAVYQRTLTFLTDHGYRIVCASPPGGTDNRHRKCLLPKQTVSGSTVNKGPRYELDIVAMLGDILLLVECKETLGDSLEVLGATGGCDYDKLKEIQAEFNSGEIATLLQRGTGVAIPQPIKPIAVLAVGENDRELPDMVVITTEVNGTRAYVPSKIKGLRF